MRSPRFAPRLIVLAGTLAAVAASARASTGPRMVVPFIRDDYAKALSEARARKVPVFIEAWAPW